MVAKSPDERTINAMTVVKISDGDGVSRFTWTMERISGKNPSLAAAKLIRPPENNEPFKDPKADKAAATDMIHPQLPSTLFLSSSFGS